MLRFAIKTSRDGSDRIPLSLHVRDDNRAPRPVKLIATCFQRGKPPRNLRDLSGPM